MTINLTVEQPTSASDLDVLAEQALKDDMNLKELTAKAKASKNALRQALEDAGKLNPDFKGTALVRTVIKAPNVFDPAKAMQLLTESEIAAYSTLSGSLVKDSVSPQEYALMQKPGTVSITLSVAS